MQCKPVTALPSKEKWTFEIKFEGYRCIALKRGSEVTLLSRNQKRSSTRSPHSGATSFSMGNWSPSIRKGGHPFSFCRTTSRARFRFISMPSTCSPGTENLC